MKWGFEYDRTRFNQPFYNNNRGHIQLHRIK